MKTKFLSILLIVIFCPLCLWAKSDNAIFLDYTREVTLNGTKLESTYSYTLQINNRAGEQYVNVTVPYSQLRILSNLEGAVCSVDGEVIRKLKKSDITTRSAISNISFYEDNYEKEFTLKHNIYPYLIKYNYTITESQFLSLARWTPLIYYALPTQHSELKITVPRDYKLRYNCSGIADPMVSLKGNCDVYEWKVDSVGSVESESFMPPILDCIPLVEVVPHVFNYDEKGSYNSWIDFGNWQCDLLEGCQELPDFEKRKVDALLSGIEDKRKKVKVLYHYLQDNTRYVNVSIETGGLSPYPASYVAQKKYGDCKALSNYFNALLAYAGIPSFYVNVYAGSPIKRINKDFVSPQCNHIIVCVPMQTDSLWLDCTSKAAFNHLGTFTQGRTAFLINRDSSRLVSTPKLEAHQVKQFSLYIVKSGRGSVVDIYLTSKARADGYAQILGINTHYDKHIRDRIMENYIVDDGFELLSYTISDTPRDSAYALWQMHAQCRTLINIYGDDAILRNIPLNFSPIESVSERKYGFQFDCPFVLEDSIKYEKPLFYHLAPQVLNDTITSAFGQYIIAIDETPTDIIVSKQLHIKSGEYEVDDYDDFHNFYTQIYSKENHLKIILNK